MALTDYAAPPQRQEGDDTLISDLTSAYAQVEAVTGAVQQLEQTVADLGTGTPPIKTAPVVGDNLLDTAAAGVQVGFYRHQADGSLQQLDGWVTTNDMTVTPGQAYAHNLAEPFTWWLDADRAPLQKVSATAGIAPALARFASGSIQVGGFPTAMFLWGVPVPATYQKFWQLLVVVATGAKPFAGKKIGLVGDSLTVQGLYIAALLEALGATVFVQKGFNGETIRGAVAGLAAGDLAGCDLILVLAGTNNYGHGGSALGTVADAASANTICGEVRFAVEYLRSQYPAAALVFGTPTERGAYIGSDSQHPEPVSPTPNPYGLTIKLIGDAIKATGGVLGVPVVDLYQASNINALTFALTLHADQLHWSELGATFVGKVLGRAINSLFRA